MLELGSGTGLAGIAAHYCGSRLTVLTDLEYVLQNLRKNVRENVREKGSRDSISHDQVISDHNALGEIFVRALDWFDASSYIKPSDFNTGGDGTGPQRGWDIIIGAGNNDNNKWIFLLCYFENINIYIYL